MRLCADPDCVQGATMCRPSLCAHRHYVQILILCSPALCADPHCVQGTTMYRPSFCAGRQLSRDPHPVQTSVVQNSAELAHFRSSAEHGGCLRLWRRCSIVDTALWRPLHYGGTAYGGAAYGGAAHDGTTYDGTAYGGAAYDDAAYGRAPLWRRSYRGALHYDDAAYGGVA